MNLKNGFRSGFKCLATVLSLLLLLGSALMITEKQQDAVPVYAEEEGVTDFVSRLYTVILERTPDESGLSEWTGYLQNGTYTGAEVAEGFIMSDEFLGKDMTNEEFVQILYRAFFGREADASGLETWVNFLDEGYRKSYVFAGFANSTEFASLCEDYGVEGGSVPVTVSEQQPNLSDEVYNIWLFVERMYTEVLERTPDIAGLGEWVGYLQNGTYTGAEVASGFILSDEFLAKVMTNEAYVQIMYRAFFGREADPSGLETWVNALETDYTKEYVFAGFANSNEFGMLCENYGITQGSVNVENTPTPTPEATPTPEPGVALTVTVNSPDGKRFESVFNEIGYLVRQKYYDADGTLLGQNTVEEYYDSGRVKRVNCADAAGNTLGSVSYSYTNGMLTRRTMSNTTGSKNYYLAEYMEVNTSGTATCSFQEAVSGTKVSTRYNTDGSFDYRWEYNADDVLVRSIGIVTSGETGERVGYFVLEGENQQVAKRTYYDLDGNVEEVCNYEYDTNGNLILEKEVDYVYDDVKITKYEYHANGQKKTVKIYEGEEENVQSVSEYDEMGSLTKQTYYLYAWDGILWLIAISEYTDGKLTKRTTCDGTGVVEYWETYEYNADGKEKKHTYYESDGSIGYYGITEYHENGEEKQYTWYYADGTINSITKYDENGVKYESTEYYYKWDDAITYEVTSYDEEGNIVKRAEYYDDGSLIFCEIYEYHENGETKQTIRYNFNEDITGIWLYKENGALEEETYYYYDNDGVLKHYTVERYNEDGKVIQKVKYDAEGNVLSYVAYEYEYNENGQMVKYITKDELGNVLSKETYEYDAAGKEVKRFKYAADGSIISGQETEYHENGRTKTVTYYIEDGKIDEFHKYTDAGKLVETIWYEYEDGVLEEYEVTEYNELGKAEEEITYDAQGNLLEKIVYDYFTNGKKKTEISYDSAGNVLEHCQYNEAGKTIKDFKYNADGTMSYGYEYEYYDNGERKQRIEYRAGNVIFSISKYDEEGNTLEVVYYSYSDGKLTGYEVVTYNTSGDYIMRIEYDAEDEVVSRNEYEYDEAGNLLEVITYDATGTVVKKWTKEYDEAGNLLQEMVYGAEGKLEWGNVYEYYASGAKKQETSYEEGGRLDYIYKYYESGEREEYTYYIYDSNTGVRSTCYVYKYSEAGIKTEEIFYKYDNITGELLNYSITKYDASGEYIERLEYDVSGALVSKEEREFDEAGNLLNYVKSDEAGNFLYGFTYEYYANGNVKLKTNYGEGKCITAYIQYTENGDILKSMTYSTDGEIKSGEENEFYSNGERKRHISYTVGGKISLVWKYNENGVCIEETSYTYDYPSMVCYGYSVTKYNDAGKKTEYIAYDSSDKIQLHYVIEYDASGALLKTTYYDANGNVESVYDADGNLITE